MSKEFTITGWLKENIYCTDVQDAMITFIEDVLRDDHRKASLLQTEILKRINLRE